MTTLVSIAQGGTGSNNAAAARSSLGAAPSAAYDAANNAYAAANTASSTGGGGYAQANAAYAQANAAYNNSNTRLSTSGGSISGDLAITGNLTVQGNATTINVSNLSVNDSIILLSTNAVGDSNDIGFIGHFDRGPTATHAGLIRKATQNQFYLFDNYEVEPTNNVIDVAGNNFTVGNLRLGIINANSYVTSAGLDVTGQANAAYGQANAAYSQANAAYGAANNRVLKAGDTMTGQLNISSGGLIVTGGNVGIGTSNVQAKLHVVSQSLANVNYNNQGAVFFEASESQVQIISDDGGSHASKLTLSTVEQSTGNNKHWMLDHKGPSLGNRFDISYFTSNSSGNILAPSGVEQLTLLTNGNVGIGTTNPGSKLDVNGDIHASNEIYLDNGKYLRFTRSSGGLSIQTLGIESGTDSVRLLTSGDFNIVRGSLTNIMTVKNGGNVGIGSTSPAVKLDVAGSMRLSATGYLGFGGGTNYIEGDNTNNYVKIGANNAEKFRVDANGSRAFEPLRSLTDSGTKQYTHLCTGSFYSGTGLTVIETNIPAHDMAGNSNMFSVKLMGFCYAGAEDGIIDMSIGCYAGEGGYYNASYCATNMPNDWVDKVYFAKNNSTGKVAIILGDTSTNRNYEFAVTNFIQGFVNVDETYAKGWSISTPANTSGYSNITGCLPTNKSPKTGFHARRTTGYTLSAATIIVYDSELYDKNSCYNNSTGRFTAPHKGQYYFRAHAQPTTTGVRVTVNFKKNGSIVLYNSISDFNVYSRQDIHNAVLLELDTNDYVEVEIDVSSSCSFDNHGTFMGVLIG